MLKPPPTPPKFKRQAGHWAPPQPWALKNVGRYEMPMASEYIPAWKHVLKQADYPTTVVVLDFETYFDEDYHMGSAGDSLSTVEFVMDERFEMLGVSVLEVHQPFQDYENSTNFWAGQQEVRGILAHLQREYGENLEGCTVVAQNAAFDAAILAWRYGIHPPYLIDELGLARHWNSRAKNDLNSLAKRLELPLKGDTKEFKGVTYRRRMKKKKGRGKGPKLPQQRPLITPEVQKKLAEYANNDVMREWEVFTLLLPRLSSPRTELRLMRHTLDLFLKPTLRVDEQRAAEIVEAMEAEIDKVCEAAGLTREDVAGDNVYTELIADAIVKAGDSLDRYTKPEKSKRGWKMADAKDDPEREWLIEHPDERVREIMAARVAIKSWPLHIARVNRIVRQAKAFGGRLPVPLKYHGAHTGRWSGAERINLQNLGSRGHELVNAIREILIADEEDELVIGDLSAIEAVVVGWVAGQDDLIEAFKQQFEDPDAKEDVYTKFASIVLGVKCRKPKKDGGIPAVEKRHKFNRNSIGKIGILGCGYGMGPEKAMGMSKGALDAEMAEAVVKTYREQNDKITQFWRDIERAFIYVAKHKRPVEMERGIRLYSRDDCDVVIVLPNGRELKYVDVRIEPDKYGDSIRVYNQMEHVWGHVWGGHLTENIVQAIARDILAEAFLRVEDRGHRVCFHVHDEIIAATRLGNGKKVLPVLLDELRRRPAWAPGLPLGAEGVVSRRYGEH